MVNKVIKEIENLRLLFPEINTAGILLANEFSSIGRWVAFFCIVVLKKRMEKYEDIIFLEGTRTVHVAYYASFFNLDGETYEKYKKSE